VQGDIGERDGARQRKRGPTEPACKTIHGDSSK
jgi:hypothetical protein